MNKKSYQLFRKSARANGFAYAIRSHGLDLYEQGLMKELDQQDPDLLRSRQLWMHQGVDSARVVILCTSICRLPNSACTVR